MTHSVNAPLLRKVLEHITAHPDEWDQGNWASVDEVRAFDSDGYPRAERPDSEFGRMHRAESNDEQFMIKTADQMTCGTAFCVAGHIAVGDGRPFVWNRYGTGALIIDHDGLDVPVSQYARRRLGLTRGQSHALFGGANSLVMLWAYAEMLTDGDIEMPTVDRFAEAGVRTDSQQITALRRYAAATLAARTQEMDD